MRIISTVLIVVGIIFGLFGIRSYWHDYRYEKTSIVTKSTISSVRIEPVRDGLANILYNLTYRRDGATDTTEYKITEAYTNKNPLPTIAQLQAATLYVQYVAKDKRGETAYPFRVMVSSDGQYPGTYGRGLFGQMFTFVLLGFIVRLFGRHAQPLKNFRG